MGSISRDEVNALFAWPGPTCAAAGRTPPNVGWLLPPKLATVRGKLLGFARVRGCLRQVPRTE